MERRRAAKQMQQQQLAATARRPRAASLNMRSASPRMCTSPVEDNGAGPGGDGPPSLRERARARLEERLAAAMDTASATSAAGGGEAEGKDGGAAAAASSAAAMAAASSLRAASSSLEAGLVEREGEARLLLLALVGAEHLLLLGPPGTAKSELCRRLSGLCGLTYFERTLTRFSTPEELFGPLSLSALERDEFRRVTDGYAPTCELLFLDEVYKSNSAILNTLLTLLNERLFDEGSARVPVPLLSAVAASNEGPESDELAALHDRFLLRKLVAPVSDDGVLALLLGKAGEEQERQGAGSKGGGAGTDATDDECSEDLAEELRRTLAFVRGGAPSVSLPRWAALLLRDARSFVRELSAEGIGGGYVSDRRLRRAADLLKSSAAAHGRKVVSVLDALAVLPHVLWEEPEEAESLSEWVESQALPEGGAEQIGFLLASVRARAAAAADAAADAAAEDGTGGGDDDEGGQGGQGGGPLGEDAEAVARAAVEAAAEMRLHLADLQQARSHLFLPPEAAAAAMQALLPVARERVAALEALAAEAVALQMALAEGLHLAGGGEALEELLDMGGGGVAEGRQAAEDAEGDVFGDGDGIGQTDGADDFSFTEEELAWGRKEAKAKLGPEEFKAWRKAAKKAAKKA